MNCIHFHFQFFFVLRNLCTNPEQACPFFLFFLLFPHFFFSLCLSPISPAFPPTRNGPTPTLRGRPRVRTWPHSTAKVLCCGAARTGHVCNALLMSACALLTFRPASATWSRSRMRSVLNEIVFYCVVCVWWVRVGGWMNYNRERERERRAFNMFLFL